MSGISIKNQRILYYGNTAGYVNKGKAIVDPMFHCEELKEYLAEKQGMEIQWTNGVYDRLANGKPGMDGETPILKNCRIHQLKPDVDIMMKFIGYDELVKQFGEPDPENYRVVYDVQLETNELDGIYEKFNLDHPTGFQGHSLSMSDIIELYDQDSSTFHYVDRFGFKEIDFRPPGQEQQQGQTMGM